MVRADVNVPCRDLTVTNINGVDLEPLPRKENKTITTQNCGGLMTINFSTPHDDIEMKPGSQLWVWVELAVMLSTT